MEIMTLVWGMGVIKRVGGGGEFAIQITLLLHDEISFPPEK